MDGQTESIYVCLDTGNDCELKNSSVWGLTCQGTDWKTVCVDSVSAVIQF